MSADGTLEFLLDSNLREIETMISPTEGTNFELSHAGSIQIHFISIVSQTINILKINTM
jgi:hypothetical protein